MRSRECSPKLSGTRIIGKERVQKGVRGAKGSGRVGNDDEGEGEDAKYNSALLFT